MYWNNSSNFSILILLGFDSILFPTLLFQLRGFLRIYLRDHIENLFNVQCSMFNVAQWNLHKENWQIMYPDLVSNWIINEQIRTHDKQMCNLVSSKSSDVLKQFIEFLNFNPVRFWFHFVSKSSVPTSWVSADLFERSHWESVQC